MTLQKDDKTVKKLVALTFDDGPNTDTTPLILDKLQQYGITASFFICGCHINEDTKGIMTRQLTLGCEIENHSWSHSDMSIMEPEEIRDEIAQTNNKIFEIVGVKPKFFRPPYISTSPVMFDLIELPFVNGVACSDWDPEVGVEERASTLLTHVNDGDIILLHDFSGNINTVNAMDQIITGLQDKGFHFVTVSELFTMKGVDAMLKHKLWTNVNQ